MKNMRNKVLILLMAALMLTSTWAGVFAFDGEQQPADNTISGENAQIDNSVGSDDSEVNAEEGTSESAEPDFQAAADPEKITVTNTSVVNRSIKGSWTKVQGATSYKVELFKTKKDGIIEEGAEPVHIVSSTNKNSYEFNTAHGITYSGYYVVRVTTSVTTGEEPDTETKDYEGLSSVIKTDRQIAEVTGVKSLSGYKETMVQWDPVEGAEYYLVRRSDRSRDWTVKASSANKKDGKYFFINGEWRGTGSVAAGKTYKYAVRAVCGTSKSPSWSSYKKCHGAVKKMTITVTLKKNRTFTALDGSGAHYSIKKGKKILTDGYGGGCYYFVKNGHQFRMNRASATGQVAHYVKLGSGTWDYSRDEAELFVEGFCKKVGVGSSTNYLMWTSFYTQHIYLMKRTDGKWKCVDDWNCGTGKASTPSPTGTKAIGNKAAFNHNLKWWSSFGKEGLGNSFHSKYSGDRVGQLLSHGCIRNPVEKAHKVYTDVAKGSRVLNY